MKKITSVFLAILIVISLIPAVFSAGNSVNLHGKQVVPSTNILGFEESYDGYETSMVIYDGKMVRSIYRNGEDETKTEFNMYYWGCIRDEKEEYVRLETSNYIVIDYYYYSPDKTPALLGNRMRWEQGRIAQADNPLKHLGFAWSHKVSSTEMVANKWDKLVISLKDDNIINGKLENYRKKGSHLVGQFKFYPLEKDMGKNDILYIGDVTFQSFDPREKTPDTQRTITFESIDKTENKSVNAKDFDCITIPEYHGELLENSRFAGWVNSFDGKTYLAGESYEMLSGCDIIFAPMFRYSYDFSSIDTGYINGYEDGTFRPQNQITRAEACKIISWLIGVNPKEKSGFSDVTSDKWYFPYVTTLERIGAFDGIYSENFGGDTPISRADFIRLVYAICDGGTKSRRLSSLSDLVPGDDCYDAVMFAMDKGIITGYEDNSFKPLGKLTRAEAVTVINRLIGRSYNENAQNASVFSDIDTHWAKGQIVAASTKLSDSTFDVVTDENKYLPVGNSAKENITALYDQSANLSGDAVRVGIDKISDIMKKNVLKTGNTEEYYGDLMTGQRYYISEKNGNDDNDGKTPETAVKTMAALVSKLRFPKKGTAILFERGGVYRGQTNIIPGVIYGSYGEGEKPILTGSLKNYADPSLWEETEVKNVYKLKESIKNVGIITFDHGLYDYGNYDGLYGKNRIYGKNIGHHSALLEDLEFYSSEDTLYLRCDGGNPGERFSSIEIGNTVRVFDGAAVYDVVFDNLSIRNTGTHGIGIRSGTNVTVTNCVFSWLGGSLLGEHGTTTTQYGNAIEIYGSCDGYYVKNNWFYQIYDTAITHQGSDSTMQNIEYSENLIEYCHWGIECWMSGIQKNYASKYNLLRNGGYGWGSVVSQREHQAELYAFYNIDAKTENMLCEYTIVDRCAGLLMEIDSRSTEKYNSNIYVQDEGKALGGLKGKGEAAGRDSAYRISRALDDDTSVFVLIPKK